MSDETMIAAPPAAQPGRRGLFRARVRAALAAELRKREKAKSAQRVPAARVPELLALATDDVIDGAAAEAQAAVPVGGPILDWLTSPEGRELIRRVVEILLSLLVGA